MDLLYKHAKNFLAGKDGREALQGIYFDGESATMSNGHLMIKFKNFPMPKRLFNPKMGCDIKCEYPKLADVIPTTFLAEMSISSNLRDCLSAVKISAEIVKGFEVSGAVQLAFVDSKLLLNAFNPDRKIKFYCQLPIDKIHKENQTEIFLNAKYLQNMLAVFKDLADPDLNISFAKNLLVFESVRAFGVISGVHPEHTKARYGYVTD